MLVAFIKNNETDSDFYRLEAIINPNNEKITSKNAWLFKISLLEDLIYLGIIASNKEDALKKYFDSEYADYTEINGDYAKQYVPKHLLYNVVYDVNSNTFHDFNNTLLIQCDNLLEDENPWEYSKLNGDRIDKDYYGEILESNNGEVIKQWFLEHIENDPSYVISMIDILFDSLRPTAHDITSTFMEQVQQDFKGY